MSDIKIDHMRTAEFKPPWWRRWFLREKGYKVLQVCLANSDAGKYMSINMLSEDYGTAQVVRATLKVANALHNHGERPENTTTPVGNRGNDNE